MAKSIAALNTLLGLKQKMDKQQEAPKMQDSLIDTIGRMEQTYKNLSDKMGTGRLGGITSKLQEWSGTGTAPEIQRYKTLQTLLFGPMARQVMLEKGVLSEQDIKRVKESIPSYWSTPDEANAAFEELRRKVNMMQQGADGLPLKLEE